MTSLWQLKRFEARISLFKSLDCSLALAAAGMNQRFTRYPPVINHNLGWCNSPVTGEFPAQMASNTEMFSFDDVIVTCYWQKMGSTYIFNDHVLVTLVLRQLYVDVTVIADAIDYNGTSLQNTWQINFISIVQSTQMDIVSLTGISKGDITRYKNNPNLANKSFQPYLKGRVSQLYLLIKLG